MKEQKSVDDEFCKLFVEARFGTSGFSKDKIVANCSAELFEIFKMELKGAKLEDCGCSCKTIWCEHSEFNRGKNAGIAKSIQVLKRLLGVK